MRHKARAFNRHIELHIARTLSKTHHSLYHTHQASLSRKPYKLNSPLALCSILPPASTSSSSPSSSSPALTFYFDSPCAMRHVLVSQPARAFATLLPLPLTRNPPAHRSRLACSCLRRAKIADSYQVALLVMSETCF